MQPSRRSEGSSVLLSVAGAGLLLGSASVHLDLYVTGYRRIPTIGTLFLLQVAAGVVLALAVVLVSRAGRARRTAQLVRAAAAVFALGTIVAYALSRAVGLFTFRERPTSAGLVAGLLELGAVVVLASLLAGAEATGGATVPGGATSTVGRVRQRFVLGAVSVALLAAVLASGVQWSSAHAAASNPVGGHDQSTGLPVTTRPVTAPVVHVVISSYTYHPDRVVARPGETIAVTNEDDVTHTMTAVPASTPFGGFDTGYVDPGTTVRITAPRTPGTYDFDCSIHNFMKGTLVVTKQASNGS